MKLRKAYPLPENVNPDTDACIVVFYPNDEAYRRALLGSLMYLEKWVAWDRDAEHTALAAALRMRQSTQRTLAALDVVDCEFLQEIIEDGDMSINVTNNVECGGSCGGCDSCTPVTPDPNVYPPEVTNELPSLPSQEDEGGDSFPDGFTDRETYLLHKCKAARELARDIIQTLGNFGSLSGVISAIGAFAFGTLITAPASPFVASLLLPFIALGLSPAIAIAIVGSFLLLIVTSGGAALMVYFNTLQTSLANQIDEITCILYSANNGQEARAGLIQFINEDVLELIFDDAGDKEVFSRAIDGILGAVLAPNIFKILFATGTAITEWLSERDDGFTCSECDDPLLGAWEYTYSSGYSGESTVSVTLNTETAFHASGDIHRGSQFGAYEFRLTHPLDPAINRVAFDLTVNETNPRIRMSGENVFSSAQPGAYLIAESAQPDAGDFDFVVVRDIPEEMHIDFSHAYSNPAPRHFDWEIDSFQAIEV